MTAPKLKPWPHEVCIVIGVTEAMAKTLPPPPAGEPMTVRVCRDCFNTILIRISSWAKVESFPQRCGKPIEGLCPVCAIQCYHCPPGVAAELRRRYRLDEFIQAQEEKARGPVSSKAPHGDDGNPDAHRGGTQGP